MPAEGLDWLPKPGLLTADEIVRLVAIGVERLGITEVRFTGGEPLLRREVVEIVARTAAVRPRPQVSITTNGIGLARLAGPLAAAGLDRVNISPRHPRPRGVQAARAPRPARGRRSRASPPREAAGLRPVKVNSVLMRGVNDHEAVGLLRCCLEKGYELRFIEQMPLDAQHGWRREDMVTADEILAVLSAAFELVPDDPGERGSAPAEMFLVDGGPARVGVIGSVTRPFCGACDRVRLTADGQLRNCLFADEESDLRAALRRGATDDELAARWIAAGGGKRAGHGIDDPSFPAAGPVRCRPSAAERCPPPRPRRACMTVLAPPKVPAPGPSRSGCSPRPEPPPEPPRSTWPLGQLPRS